jgi:hypothetical protein
VRNLHTLDVYRRDDLEMTYAGEPGNEYAGIFEVPNARGLIIRVLASSDMGWDHVSASLRDRCPTWDEMSYIKQLFFKDTETAMQLHVPKDDHINCHPHTLHLWRPHGKVIPRPPGFMVGPVQGRTGT